MDKLSEDEIRSAKEIIYSLDLSSIVPRLMTSYKWSETQALEACKQYRNYLFLKKKYYNLELPPSADIDEVWHNHILHTENYIEFSNNAFGAYLHHRPNHTKNAKTITPDQLAQLFEEQTQRLYYQEFGEYLYSVKQTQFQKLIVINIMKLLNFFTLKYNKRIL